MCPLSVRVYNLTEGHQDVSCCVKCLMHVNDLWVVELHVKYSRANFLAITVQD